jgi:hypothetical protein
MNPPMKIDPEFGIFKPIRGRVLNDRFPGRLIGLLLWIHLGFDDHIKKDLSDQEKSYKNFHLYDGL